MGLQCTVVLSVIVDKGGLTRDVRVMNPIGLGLDEKAIAAVSQWRFTPGMEDGQPVAVMVTIEVDFRLLSGKPGWRLERADFHNPKARPARLSTTSNCRLLPRKPGPQLYPYRSKSAWTEFP